MRCQGYEQHSETGMVRRCSLEDGHEGLHKHELLPNSCPKYGYDRDERELELIGRECSELSKEPFHDIEVDHITATKEWAKLFLSNWNRAVKLFDDGNLFAEDRPPNARPSEWTKLDQQEYARICCAWLIPNRFEEPHCVAQGE